MSLELAGTSKVSRRAAESTHEQRQEQRAVPLRCRRSDRAQRLIWMCGFTIQHAQATSSDRPAMPGRNGGGAAVGGLVVILLLTAMTLNTFSGVWDAMMENKGPGARLGVCVSMCLLGACSLLVHQCPGFHAAHPSPLLIVVMVIVGLLIAWFSMRDSSESNGVAGHAGGPSARGRGQLVGSRSQPHPSPPPWLAPAGSSGDGSGTATRQQQEGSRSGGGAGSQALSLQQEGSTSGKLGSPADAPPRRRKVQGNLRSGAVAMVASSAAAGKQGSESGRSALVLANDTSLALATSELGAVVMLCNCHACLACQTAGAASCFACPALLLMQSSRHPTHKASTNPTAPPAGCTFLCAKPAGCGYRHACPDLGRRWMHCDKHGSHPLPSDGRCDQSMGGRALGLLRMTEAVGGATSAAKLALDSRTFAHCLTGCPCPSKTLQRVAGGGA